MGLRGATRRFFRRLGQPAAGSVNLGDLRRTTPLSRGFGYQRGTPIDRFYIEDFLRRHSEDIRGDVLEVADARYTRAFGGERVTRSDVIHPVPGNPRATVVGDFATGAGLESERYDCLIVTQTLQYLFDLAGAIATFHRVLRPGGVLLLTAPALSQLSRRDADAWGEYWRFTSHALRRLLELQFPPDSIQVEAHGNVLAAVGFLEGLVQEDLTSAELEAEDPEYELVAMVRAVKPNT